MNKYQKRLMDKPSIETILCPFCGHYASERHHIVPRSQGGTDGPTITVCGFGNAGGCHGLLHSEKLHLGWDDDDGWIWAKSSIPMKHDEALRSCIWRKLRYR